MRNQRDRCWQALEHRYKPFDKGGMDETLNRMPDIIKVELVNGMAREPACWTAETTMKRSESYVSTKRHEMGKKRQSTVRAQPHTTTRAFYMFCLPTHSACSTFTH